MRKFVRENILNLKAYTSARHQNLDGILLDANENPYPNPILDINMNRYPDPNHLELKEAIADRLNIKIDNMTITSGSDEAFDILFKTFTSSSDEMIIPNPTYGMYQVLADIFDVNIVKTNLDQNYQPDINEIKKLISKKTKAIILCHPSNPVGNLIDEDLIKGILKLGYPTIIDEAYIDFCIDDSAIKFLDLYPNLIITRTLSKAYGLAGARCGFIIASKEMTNIFNAVKLPYNLNAMTLKVALDTLTNFDQSKIDLMKRSKERLLFQMRKWGFIDEILPSVTNFVTFITPFADELYEFMKARNIIIRRIGSIENAIRISIGTESEMTLLCDMLKLFEKEMKYV